MAAGEEHRARIKRQRAVMSVRAQGFEAGRALVANGSASHWVSPSALPSSDFG